MSIEQHGAWEPSVRGLRVLVAGYYRTFAETLAAGLRLLGHFDPVDVALSPAQARHLLGVRRYDVLLLDPVLDLESWLALLRELGAGPSPPVVVVISELDEVQQAIDLLHEDVRAWVPQDVSLQGLLQVIHEAVMGHTTMPAALLDSVLQELLDRRAKDRESHSFVDELTPRQFEVLECLAGGLNRSQIAERLRLSPHTVRTHIHEVLRKAGVHSALAALALARETGYLGGPSAHDRSPRSPIERRGSRPSWGGTTADREAR